MRKNPSPDLRSGTESGKKISNEVFTELTEFARLALKVLTANNPQGAKDLLALVGDRKAGFNGGLANRLERLANKSTCEVLARPNIIAGGITPPPGTRDFFSSDGMIPQFSNGGTLLDSRSRKVDTSVPDGVSVRSSTVFSMLPGLSRPIVCGRGSFRGR